MKKYIIILITAISIVAIVIGVTMLINSIINPAYDVADDTTREFNKLLSIDISKDIKEIKKMSKENGYDDGTFIYSQAFPSYRFVDEEKLDGCTTITTKDDLFAELNDEYDVVVPRVDNVPAVFVKENGEWIYKGNDVWYLRNMEDRVALDKEFVLKMLDAYNISKPTELVSAYLVTYHAHMVYVKDANGEYYIYVGLKNKPSDISDSYIHYDTQSFVKLLWRDGN